MAKWKVKKSRWVGMALPWMVLNEDEEIIATFSTQQKAIDYARSKSPRVEKYSIDYGGYGDIFHRLVFGDGNVTLIPKRGNGL